MFVLRRERDPAARLQFVTFCPNKDVIRVYPGSETERVRNHPEMLYTALFKCLTTSLSSSTVVIIIIIISMALHTHISVLRFIQKP